MTRETPGSTLAWQTLGQACLIRKEYPEARESFLKVVSLDSKDQKPLICLGQILLEETAGRRPILQGAPFDPIFQRAGNEAEVYLRKAVEIEPRLAYSHALLCRALCYQHRFAEAEEAGRKAVSLNPELAIVWTALADSLYYAQKYDDAIDAYEKGLRLDPFNLYHWQGMVVCYRTQGAFSAGEKKLRDLVGEFPGSGPGWHSLAMMLTAQNKTEEAAQGYLKAIALDKNNHLSWNNLGLIHSKRGEFDQAVECYQKALQQMPAYAEAWSNLGYTYFKQDKTAEAIDAYQHALQAQPNHVNALINLAQAAAKIGNMDLARKACDQLATVNPAMAEQTRQRFLR
jgi:tetratricopeptide (TPR) repeat protein